MDILTVLQNSFIHEENNDIFKDTKNVRDTVQINTFVQTGVIQCLIQSTAGADVASAARESGNSVTEDASSNILRLVKFIVPVGSLGNHSSIKKGNFSNLLLWMIFRDGDCGSPIRPNSTTERCYCSYCWNCTGAR